MVMLFSVKLNAFSTFAAQRAEAGASVRQWAR
jgi:hypothetical protein